MTVEKFRPDLKLQSGRKATEQLNRILASRAFRQKDRLKRFLSFIVGEAIKGRGERLKEFVVGVEVFGKPESFDPRNDPIVRVQARHLRAQLEEYYIREGPNDDLLIELPKGCYEPIFRPLKSFRGKPFISPGLVSRNTVVVLPFSDHSAARDQEYFCRGMRDEIIHALASLEAIRLVAWYERGLPETQIAMKDAVERLVAALIVTGSVRKRSTDIRVTINLIEASSGSYLWSRAMGCTLENIFSAQEQVARIVLEQVEHELVGGAHSRSARHHRENLAAYNLYVQGLYHVNQRTEEGLRKAVEFFEKAIAEDAQYARAYSGLADTYGLLGHYGVLAPSEVWTKAASNAAWAVLQDENSAEAHTSLAHVKSTQDWDWLGAEREFQRALALDPRYATAHHWYAMSCLAPMGRLGQACEEMTLAQALDPISPIIARDLARIYYYQRDYDTALEQCDCAIELNPHFSPAYWILGLVQEQQGELDESTAAFKRALHLSPESPLLQSALGRILALSGKQSEALRILRELHQLSEKRYVSPFELASLHFVLCQSDEGFQWLAKAFQDRCFELICLRVDPRWEFLRGDARFRKLSDKLRLP